MPLESINLDLNPDSIIYLLYYVEQVILFWSQMLKFIYKIHNPVKSAVTIHPKCLTEPGQNILGKCCHCAFTAYNHLYGYSSFKVDKDHSI